MAPKLNPESIIHSVMDETLIEPKRPLWGVKLEKYAVRDEVLL